MQVLDPADDASLLPAVTGSRRSFLRRAFRALLGGSTLVALEGKGALAATADTDVARRPSRRYRLIDFTPLSPASPPAGGISRLFLDKADGHLKQISHDGTIIDLAQNPGTTDVVDVTSFGAKGDGVTPATAAIQAAADSLTLGGVLYFPPGIYVINGNGWTPAAVYPNPVIRLMPGTSVKGAGSQATVLRCADIGPDQSVHWPTGELSDPPNINMDSIPMFSITSGAIEGMWLIEPANVGDYRDVNDKAKRAGRLDLDLLVLGDVGVHLGGTPEDTNTYARDLFIDGFTNGLVAVQSGAHLEAVTSVNAYSHGIALLGSAFTTLDACCTSNFKDGADAAAPLSGLFIRAFGTFVSAHLADEGAAGASIYIDGDDTRIQGAKVYAVVNGIGIEVAGGERNTIINADIRPFGNDPTVSTIAIDGAANATTLVAVTTDDGAGNPGISDSGTKTLMLGVNGKGLKGTDPDLLPWSIELDPCQMPAGVVGTWGVEYADGGERRYNVSGAQGDKIALPPVVLAAGVWEIEITLDGASGGTPVADITTYLDAGVVDASWTPTPTVSWIHHSIPGVVVATTGKHELSFEAASVGSVFLRRSVCLRRSS